jgi:hypothetical protein
MGTAIGAHVFLDIVMADLTEVCVWVYLGTTVRTGSLADGLTTLRTEHRLWVVDGSAVRTSLSCCLTLLSLIHGLLWRIGLRLLRLL